MTGKSIEESSYESKCEQAWHYPSGFAMPSVSMLAERVQCLWPGIDVSHIATLAERFSALPAGFDGIEAKPKIAYLGQRWEMAQPYECGYGPLVKRVLAMLHSEQKGMFINAAAGEHATGEMTARYIRLHSEVRALVKEAEAATPGDVMVMPVSLGNLYAGYSPQSSRQNALSRGYLPNGSAYVGCSLLVMPERLTAYRQLGLDCPGDEWNWAAMGCWVCCPTFYSEAGCVRYNVCSIGSTDGRSGGVVSFPGTSNST